MANKRQLKKEIRFVCGDLAAEILMARAIYPGFDNDTVVKIINDIARLQESAVSAVSFSFDKTPRDFADGAAYRKALNAYNKKAYAKLAEEFHKGVEAIVKEMNKAMPEEVRQANKAK